MQKSSAIGLLSCMVLFGCAVSETPVETTHRAIPPTATVAATVSDMPGDTFAGHGVVELLPLVADDSELIHLRAYGATAENEVSLEARLTPDELSALVRGDTVRPSEQPNALFIAGGTRMMRGVTSLHLTISDGSAHISVALGGKFFETNLEPSHDVATMEFWGQLPVSCATLDAGGNVIGDPTWSSDFCAGARDRHGLSSWISETR